VTVAFGTDFNGPGLLLSGLAWNPDDEGLDVYHLDPLGVLTFGFVWWLKSVWENCAEDGDASWSTASDPTTTWSDVSDPSTSWTDDDCGEACS
jgi:hypothetical protein